MLRLTREHLASAASRALASPSAPSAIIIHGVGLLDRDTAARIIVTIGPALLAGDRDRAVELTAMVLRPLPLYPDPAAVGLRLLEARAVVDWFAALATEAVLQRPLPKPAPGTSWPVHLRVPDSPHHATLRPHLTERAWLVEVHTAEAVVARSQLHELGFDAALALTRAALHAIASCAAGAPTTPCDECGQAIPDDAPSVLDPAHALSCTLHPWSVVTS